MKRNRSVNTNYEHNTSTLRYMQRHRMSWRICEEGFLNGFSDLTLEFFRSPNGRNRTSACLSIFRNALVPAENSILKTLGRKTHPEINRCAGAFWFYVLTPVVPLSSEALGPRKDRS